MQYLFARVEEYTRETAYRIYMTDSMRQLLSLKTKQTNIARYASLIEIDDGSVKPKETAAQVRARLFAKLERIASKKQGEEDNEST